MRFIEPKRATRACFTLSGQNAAIFENYAKYTGYSEEEIVAMKQLPQDQDKR